jgi:hypothetical protein
MYKIRAFRAVEDNEMCQRFAEGHKNVLSDYGVTKVTTAKTDWFHNPNAYVVLVLSEDENTVLGGERIHISCKEFHLPIEEAISIVDKKVYDLVASYNSKGITGELCGLWNSKAIAGKGISVLLTKIGVSFAKILKMDSLFVLCAPYTVEMCVKAGFQIEKSIGDNGTFIYPKLDLIATSLIIEDLNKLNHAEDDFKERILNLANNPVQKSIETGPKGDFEVDFNLQVPQSIIN